MLHVLDNRLIEHTLAQVKRSELEYICALVGEKRKFNSLKRRLKKRYITTIQQLLPTKIAKQFKYLELPLVLWAQYHYAKDSSFLKHFDHILVIPTDMFIDRRETGSIYQDLIQFHQRNKALFTMMYTTNGRGSSVDDLRLSPYQRIYSIDNIGKGEKYSDTGVYIFSREFFEDPLKLIQDNLKGQLFRSNPIFAHLIDDICIDCGTIDNIREIQSHLPKREELWTTRV